MKLPAEIGKEQGRRDFAEWFKDATEGGIENEDDVISVAADIMTLPEGVKWDDDACSRYIKGYRKGCIEVWNERKAE